MDKIMNIIPDWAPSIHPMLVHFPIALLITAAVLDITGLVLKKDGRLRFCAVTVYVLGVMGALASFFTGRDAGDSILLSADANPFLTDHADWALRLVWFFGIYALIRIVELWRYETPRAALWWPLTIIGAGGLFLVQETAERGARLVYEQGVGVVAATNLFDAPQLVGSSGNDLTTEPGKAWAWTPTSPSHWSDNFSFLEGEKSAIGTSLIGAEERGDVLALEVNYPPIFLIIEDAMQNVQIDLSVNLDAFEGTFTVAHNVQDTLNYMFMEIAGGMMRQGVRKGGSSESYDESPYSAEGWQQLRVVSDQTHFRAYGGQRVITHGHGKAARPGAIGLRLEGFGTVLIDRVQAISLARSDGMEHEEH